MAPVSARAEAEAESGTSGTESRSETRPESVPEFRAAARSGALRDGAEAERCAVVGGVITQLPAELAPGLPARDVCGAALLRRRGAEAETVVGVVCEGSAGWTEGGVHASPRCSSGERPSFPIR
jgi:hypothetical protein